MEKSPITWTNEKRKLSDLLPWDHNPREINKKEAERLGESLETFGQIQTIAIGPNGELYDGHQRRMVWSILPRLGPDFAVDVRVSSRPLTEKERQKLVIFLHRGTVGQWDWDIMANNFEVPELLEWGFEESDLQLDWGSDEKAEDPGAQVDKAEELQEKWQVNSGDIWRMGEHLVICADCREPDTWTRLLEAAGIDKVNGVFTSPPYAEQRKKQYGGTPADRYVEWWDAVQANVRASLADDRSFFMNIKPHCEDGQRVLYVFDLVLAMVRRWGWRFVDELCWVRQGVPGKWSNRFKNAFEPIYQFCAEKDIKFYPDFVMHRSESAFKYTGNEKTTVTGSGFFQGHTVGASNGNAYPGNILRVPVGNMPGDAKEHSGAFPLKLPSFFIRAYSDNQDVWCDPFLGSGTTIIAAHQNNRRGIGIERLEKYVAVTLERWSTLTGGEPALLGI